MKGRKKTLWYLLIVFGIHAKLLVRATGFGELGAGPGLGPGAGQRVFCLFFFLYDSLAHRRQFQHSVSLIYTSSGPGRLCASPISSWMFSSVTHARKSLYRNCTCFANFPWHFFKYYFNFVVGGGVSVIIYQSVITITSIVTGV